MLKLLSTILTLMSLIVMISYSMKNKILKNREKSSPFECGFDPQHKMRSAFSLRFFLITILFLIFDVEIIVMLPIPVCVQMKEILTLINLNFLIFLLLFVGLIFEWNQGALNWKWKYI